MNINKIKTGTTVFVLINNNRLYICSDKQITFGSNDLEYEKETSLKILKIKKGIYMSIAGMACEGNKWYNKLVKKVKYLEAKYDLDLDVKEISQLFSRFPYNYENTAFIISGYRTSKANDENKKLFQIYSIEPNSILEHKSYAIGSGSPYVYGFLRNEYLQENNTLCNIVDKCKNVMLSAIKNDIYSGRGIQIIILEKDENNILKEYEYDYDIEYTLKEKKNINKDEVNENY